MKNVLSLYEPIEAYKPFADNIGIVDGPIEYLSWLTIKIPFPTRMTVVRLVNGDLFLHSPIAFDARLANRLQSMGTIRHLVSPNKLHYAHIEEWALAFPQAITWASPGVRERARTHGIDVHFRRDLSADAPAEWHGQIDQTIIPGSFMDEVVFFHKESKTLILADTIENSEPDKIRQPYRFLVKLSGAYHPYGKMPIDLRSTFWPKKRAVKDAIERISSWQPERITLCHGRCYDRNGNNEIRRAFRWAIGSR
ncbi:MAG: DUF4336 domain-containing protein [Methylovirgula sp.]